MLESDRQETETEIHTLPLFESVGVTGLNVLLPKCDAKKHNHHVQCFSQ